MTDMERLIALAQRALQAAHGRPRDMDYYLDSAALDLHAIYAGLENLGRQIASTVDGKVPPRPGWHRELLEQMGLDIPNLRPPVLSAQAIHFLEEYLRFRHVLRNVYTYLLDAGRVGRLVKQIRPIFDQVKQELQNFMQFLGQVGS